MVNFCFKRNTKLKKSSISKINVTCCSTNLFSINYKPWHIRNPNISIVRGIFRALEYSKVRRSQSAKRHLQDVLPRQARHLAKTACRCPKDVLNANLKVIFVRYLGDTFARYIVDALQKTS